MPAVKSPVLLFIVLFAWIVSVDWSAPATLGSDELGTVIIERFDGTNLKGTITKIDAEGNVFGKGLPKSLNLRDIVGLETAKTMEARDVYNVSLHLVDGGILRVRNPELQSEKMVFRSGNGLAELPVSLVRAIVWKQSESVDKLIANPSVDEDSVLVQTSEGERGVQGIVEGLDRQELKINYQGESRTIGLERLNAIVMADIGLAAPDGPMATVRLTDGSTTRGVLGELADGRLSLQTSGRTALEINADKVVSIAINSDRLIFLSDLDPVDVQQKSVFTVTRPWQRDQSVEKRKLAIGSGESDQPLRFKKGLGTQSFTELVFRNEDGFDQFAATVGIAIETQGRGDCRMVVRGDGIELWSGRVRGTDPPQEIKVDIKGMQDVALVVYPGEDFDLADHANWGNARFLKSK